MCNCSNVKDYLTGRRQRCDILNVVECVQFRRRISE